MYCCVRCVFCCCYCFLQQRTAVCGVRHNFQNYTLWSGNKVTNDILFPIALILSLFLVVVGERGFVFSPRPNISHVAPTIPRISRQHLHRLSLPIIRWCHTVSPYYDTSRVPSNSRLPAVVHVTKPPNGRVHSTPPIYATQT